MKINKVQFQNDLKNVRWALQGDSFEQKYGHIVTDTFPNLEEFWQKFVVPSTGRVHKNTEFIRQPDVINSKISIIGNHNYVIFQHIIKCYSLIESQDYFAVDDFYTHLVASLDNFEQLVEKFTLALAEYDTTFKPTFLSELSENDFIKKMKVWYRSSYKDLYNNYKSRGKFSIELQNINQYTLLQQVFGAKELKEYSKFNQEVRQTRNLYAHGVRIGNIVIPQLNVSFQPKHSKILDYRDDYRKVFKVQSDQKKFIEDFIETKTQMQKDISNLKNLLNLLYEKLLVMITNAPDSFYKEMYSIEFE